MLLCGKSYTALTLSYSFRFLGGVVQGGAQPWGNLHSSAATTFKFQDKSDSRLTMPSKGWKSPLC